MTIYTVRATCLHDDDDDVYLIKLQREVLQNLISTRKIQISQICGIKKIHMKIIEATDITEQR